MFDLKMSFLQTGIQVFQSPAAEPGLYLSIKPADNKNLEVPALCYVDYPFTSHLGVVKQILHDEQDKVNMDDMNRIQKWQFKHGVLTNCKKLVVIEYIESKRSAGQAVPRAQAQEPKGPAEPEIATRQ